MTFQTFKRVAGRKVPIEKTIIVGGAVEWVLPAPFRSMVQSEVVAIDVEREVVTVLYQGGRVELHKSLILDCIGKQERHYEEIINDPKTKVKRVIGGPLGGQTIDYSQDT